MAGETMLTIIGNLARDPELRRGCLIVCVWDHLIERKRSW